MDSEANDNALLQSFSSERISREGSSACLAGFSHLLFVFYREAARERRRPRRQQLRILRPLKMLRFRCSSYAFSVHLQPLPARAPALPGRFAVVQSLILLCSRIDISVHRSYFASIPCRRKGHGFLFHSYFTIS